MHKNIEQLSERRGEEVGSRFAATEWAGRQQWRSRLGSAQQLIEGFARIFDLGGGEQRERGASAAATARLRVATSAPRSTGGRPKKSAQSKLPGNIAPK